MSLDWLQRGTNMKCTIGTGAWVLYGTSWVSTDTADEWTLLATEFFKIETVKVASSTEAELEAALSLHKFLSAFFANDGRCE